MPFTDDQIRQAVLNLFKKYDKDNSGYVENQEIPSMCNDLANELVTKKNYSKD
jgi:Ca2+-binding EF-hand superfamily protein